MNTIGPQMERKMDSSSARKSSKFIGFLGTAQIKGSFIVDAPVTFIYIGNLKMVFTFTKI